MSGQPARAGVIRTLDRRTTSRGELVLRADGPDFEIISNGTFLMDTRDGRSERLLVRAALGSRRRPVRLLVGGLGVGFSLLEALGHPAVTVVTVVEIEPVIIEWHRSRLSALTAEALADPRVEVVCADLLDWLAGGGAERYNVICLDIDNGPQWTVAPTNASLYTEAGLRLASRRLAPGGCAAVWSAATDRGFEARLRAVFGSVRTLEVAVPRGEPDVVYLATRE